MVFLIIFLAGIFLALGVGVLAGVSDLRRLIIPNSYSVIVIAGFALCYGALYFGGRSDVFGSLSSHVLSAVIMFLVTFALFSFGVLGAGDSKFGSACALWVGVKFLPIFLFYMTLCGGVLGLLALYIKHNKPFESPTPGGWVEKVQTGADKVPYGVAIFCGLLAAFLYAEYFSPDILASFLEPK